HAEQVGDELLALAFAKELPDQPDTLLVQPRPTQLITLPKPPPLVRLAHVVLVRPEVQMLEVHAPRVIAVVQHHEAPRDRSVRLDPDSPGAVLPPIDALAQPNHPVP